MKKYKYITPEIDVIDVEVQQPLALSGGNQTQSVIDNGGSITGSGTSIDGKENGATTWDE